MTTDARDSRSYEHEIANLQLEVSVLKRQLSTAVRHVEACLAPSEADARARDAARIWCGRMKTLVAPPEPVPPPR